MRFPRVRDVLNKLKWDVEFDGRADLEFAFLTVKDRVSGTKEISGADITNLGVTFFEVGDPSENSGPPSLIPYYKVVKIVLGNEVIWERPAGPGPEEEA